MKNSQHCGKSTFATGGAWSLKALFRLFWQEGDAVGGEHSLIHGKHGQSAADSNPSAKSHGC
jgi:hypothetical protein